MKTFPPFILESNLSKKGLIFSIVPNTSDFPAEKNLKNLNIPYSLNWLDDRNLEEKFHESKDKIAGVIIHGGPLKSFSQLTQVPKSILESKIPKLGICLGMEIMALNFGANLIESKESTENPGEGRFSIELCKMDKCLLFDGIGPLPGIYKVPFSHRYIVGLKPQGVNIIASSLETPIAGIYHEETNSHGIQFGISNTLIGEKILSNFYNKICQIGD